MTRYVRSVDRHKRIYESSVDMGPHNPTGWTDWMEQPPEQVATVFHEFGVNQHGFHSMPSLYENGALWPDQNLLDGALANAVSAAGQLQFSGNNFSPGIFEGADYGFGIDPDPGEFFYDESDYWLSTRLYGLYSGNATRPGVLLPETPRPEDYLAYELEGSSPFVADQTGGRLYYRRMVNVSYRRRVDRGLAYSEEIWRDAYGRPANLELLLGDPNDLPTDSVFNTSGYDWQSNRPSGVGGTVVASYPLVEYPNESAGVDPPWTTLETIQASPHYDWTGIGGRLFVQRVAPADTDIPFQLLVPPGAGNPHSVDHSGYEGVQWAQLQFASYLHYRHPRVRFLLSDPRPSTTATPVSTRFHRF